MYHEKASGVAYAVSAHLLWGVLPIYWKLLDSVFSVEILANRIVWAFLFTILVIAVTKQWNALKCIAKDRKQLLYIFFASILIAINWGLYIWSVNAGKIVDASLGYFINPLFAVILGVFIFKEKLNYWTMTALTFAFIGVIIKTVQYGQIPWISLILATSFALYGAMKKAVTASSIVGLTLETAMLTPIATAFIVSRHLSGVGAFEAGGLAVTLLLIGSGVATAVPLLLFSSAAKRLPLSLLGFTQYISPTISLVIGIFLFHEGFTLIDLLGFSFIWLALVIYTISQLGLAKRSRDIEQLSH